MKRKLNFNKNKNKYLIYENDTAIFSVETQTLLFDSRNFYESIFKKQIGYCSLELLNNIENPTGVDNYVYKWIHRVISSICDKLNEGIEKIDTEEIEQVDIPPLRMIELFELSACAGNGNYSTDSDIESIEIETENFNADFAVTLSGNSMQPLYNNGDIVLVQKAVQLFDNDIGIFVVNGEIMCKKVSCKDNELYLVPLNTESQYKSYEITEDTTMHIQGKVIAKHNAK